MCIRDRILDEVWAELFRVMKAGAIACINIGDAVRSIKNRFQLFANGSRIQSKLLEIGFDVLPAKMCIRDSSTVAWTR